MIAGVTGPTAVAVRDSRKIAKPAASSSSSSPPAAAAAVSVPARPSVSPPPLPPPLTPGWGVHGLESGIASSPNGKIKIGKIVGCEV